MIRIDKLKIFPYKTPEIFWPGNNGNETPLNMVFFPENSNFNQAYRRLKIPRRFCRYGTILPAVVPRLMYTRDLVSQYLLYKLVPTRNLNASIRNVFIDTTQYLTKVDERFRRASYRRPIVLSKIQDYLNQVNTNSNLVGRNNVLMYYVDITQPLGDGAMNKRGWTIVDMFKRNEFYNYQYIMLCVWTGVKTIWYMLKGNNSQLSWTRVFNIINQLKTRVDSNQIEQSTNEICDDIVVTSDVEEAQKEFEKSLLSKYKNQDQNQEDTNLVYKKVIEEPGDINAVDKLTTISPNDIDTKKVIKRYLETRPTLTNFLKSQPVTPYTSQKVLIASILSRNLRNDALMANVIKKIKPENYSDVANKLKKDVVPKLLKHDSYENESRQLVFKDTNINAINDHKNPSSILNKRKIDFQKSLSRDLINSFLILGKNENFPLKLIDFKYFSVPIQPGDLEPSKFGQYKVLLQDDKNKVHEVIIEVPEIQDDGTFLINGNKKYMMFQNIIDPIFFLKKNQGTLQTMYAPVTVFLKETKHKNYFCCYIAGYMVTLSILLTYDIGLDKLGKIFGFSYRTVDTDKKDGKYYSIDFSDNKSIEFSYDVNNKYITYLLDSFKESAFYQTGLMKSTDLFDKTKLAEAIIKECNNRNSIFRIDQVIKNIMEPISVEVLQSKMLPTVFEECIKYIAENIAAGRVDSRNDLSKQRIRSSEVMSYQIQKQILASYSQYLTDREHGNEDAKYFCDTRQIIKSIVNSSESKLMRDLDNINPYDSLSALTSISPVGDGGVANSDGITKDARNIHDSYYGNVDSMDTPENGNIGILNHLTIDAAIGNEKGSFGLVNPKDNIGAGALSVCSAVVPFVNHNDGCRVMFSGSQGRQAIPIIGNEKPLVQTGYETILTSMLDQSYVKKANNDSTITKVTQNAIYMRDRSGSEQKVILDNPVLKTSVGQIKGSLNSFNPVVKVGQKVKAGQIVAEGKHIKDGVISVGTNMLVAMMGWKGYTFEDGYIVSESVANKTLTSTSYEEKEVLITKDDNIKFIAESGKFTNSGDILLIRSSKNIEQIIGMDEDEITEGQQIIKSPGGRILSIEIYPNISIKKFPVLIPEYEKFKAKYEEANGSFPEKFFNSSTDNGIPFSGIKIIFKIERYDSCVLGDKISNNHGGKGTITHIELDKNMPVTPWGERIDLLFNPIAVINRMNPGTIYEMYCGLIAKTLAKRIVNAGYKKTTAIRELMSRVYTTLDKTPNKVLSTNIMKSFDSLNNDQYVSFVNSIIDDNYVVPIYVPQFKEPSKEMIYDAMRVLGLRTKYYLTLPEFGTKTYEPVAVGYLYYKKLEQQALYKQSVRSTGKYNVSTGQATAGKAQGGGQRVGEMDSYCMISHGCINTLRELFGPMSDDKVTKDQIISNIITNGEASYIEPKNNNTKNRMKIWLYGMMLDTDIN